MFELIRESVDENFRASVTAEMLTDEELMNVYKLSSSQDVAHLVASTLSSRRLLPDTPVGATLKRLLMLAAYRHEGQAFEMGEISLALESSHIPFILLKGSELCFEYPEPYLRTRSDIDVLVKEQQLEEAREALCRILGYSVKNAPASTHDISLVSRGGVHVELHFSLWDKEIINALGEPAAKAIEEVWQFATLYEGSSYRYVMDDARFCLYHYAHMAKHVLNGGCGVKPFVDTLILKKRSEERMAKFYTLAKDCGIMDFVSCADHLTDVWFGDGEHNDVSRRFEEYVLRGGVYGTFENRLSVSLGKKRGKLGYVLGRIFMPWKTLKERYPVLEKHRWLTPVFEVVRWGSLVFRGRTGRVVGELRVNATITESQSIKARELMKDIGL